VIGITVPDGKELVARRVRGVAVAHEVAVGALGAKDDPAAKAVAGTAAELPADAGGDHQEGGEVHTGGEGEGDVAAQDGVALEIRGVGDGEGSALGGAVVADESGVLIVGLPRVRSVVVLDEPATEEVIVGNDSQCDKLPDGTATGHDASRECHAPLTKTEPKNSFGKQGRDRFSPTDREPERDKFGIVTQTHSQGHPGRYALEPTTGIRPGGTFFNRRLLPARHHPSRREIMLVGRYTVASQPTGRRIFWTPLPVFWYYYVLERRGARRSFRSPTRLRWSGTNSERSE
jgi:hypothetical protein